jgi:serine/threonine protein kinase/tetratricopeptide (TPR) repeat protein
MGSVYRGRHRKTGVEVAIKVIKRHIDKAALREFRREVQAQAGLVHPLIVRLLEYGRISDEAAESSGGKLEAGSPFVAMELADRGSLFELSGRYRWETLRGALEQVLEGLAFAHARGVLHRDLKPGNLLLFDREEGTQRVKIADFGLAHILGDEQDRATEELSLVSGTPLYIAPEQTRGAWREYGPWTDLYALGCIAWEFVCRAPPYTGESAVEIMIKHNRGERPPFAPELRVPQGLEAWLEGLLAVAPEDRFARAADALRALRRLETIEGPSDTGPGGASTDDDLVHAPTKAHSDLGHDGTGGSVRSMGETRADIAPPTIPLDGARDASGTVVETTVPETNETSEGPDEGAAVPDPMARSLDESTPGMGRTVPATWRRSRRAQLPSQIVGTGLGLFDLREPPFVDRDAERDRIWNALRAAEQADEPRVVFVIGESGAGKSRLVEWMAARADELGAARVMRAVHGRASKKSGAGVGGMVRRLVRGQKLGRGDLYERLCETLPALDEQGADREMEARAATELIYPTDEDQETVDGPRFRFASQRHKSALVARLVGRYAGARPALVWLDDAQWSETAMDLVEYLTRSPFDQPAALVVVTIRAEALAENKRLRERVTSLVDEDCTDIRLEPLEPDDHRTFVGRILPLEAELADRIAERTEGNPLFATQLLGHLVEKGQLEVGADGFEIAEGADLEVPDQIHGLWMRRLSRFVAGLEDDRPEAVWAALERAAALGREVDAHEWMAVCDDFGLVRPDLVRERLIERGLAERTEDGWSFAHDLLVEALHRRAREHGQWATHNRRCAELLEQIYRERPKQTAARRAEHWIEGGRPEEALEPLMEESQQLLRAAADYQASQATLERRGELVDQLGIPADDPRSIENEIDLARVGFKLGVPPHELLARVKEQRNRAERIGDDRLVARAAAEMSAIHGHTGDLKAARAAGRMATARATASGDAMALFRALFMWGCTEFESGHLDAAENHFSELRRRASERHERPAQLDAQRMLAWIWMSRGFEERAAALFEQTRREARRAGFQAIQVSCHNGLGEVARFGGRADAARRHYRRFGRLFRELGNTRPVAASHLNLAQVELMDGRFDAAREELEEAARLLEELSMTVGWIDWIRLVELTLAAGTETWSVFDELYAAYGDGWPTEARLTKDHPWLMEMAGDYAAEADEAHRARQVWTLSRELWGRLDDEEAARRVGQKLDRGDS